MAATVDVAGMMGIKHRGGHFRIGMALGFACFVIEVGRMEGARLEVEEEGSRIEIAGKAWGFIPAVFAFESFDARIEIDPDAESLSAARIELPYRTLSSGDPGKDRRIQRWLEVDRFPEGRFVMETLSQDNGEAIAAGELSLHGERGPMRFRHQVQVNGANAVVEGEAVIDYRDWGLPIFRVFVFSVNPELTIRIRIMGKLEMED